MRIRVTPATEAAGVAGLKGNVYGETTPSVTSIDVIGQVTSDYALNVWLDERGDAFWFAPELVEFVDHAPGTVMSVRDKRWVRSADGQWVEQRRSWLSRVLRRP